MEQLDILAKQQVEKIQSELYVVSEGVNVGASKTRGRKLSKHILTKFFTNEAPKYQTLDAVKTALAAVYKQNNVEANSRVISSIISRYAKKVELANKKREPDQAQVKESFELDEKALTQQQQKKKEEIIKAMKKHIDRFKKKYGSDAERVMYATATQLAKEDTSIAPLDE